MHRRTQCSVETAGPYLWQGFQGLVAGVQAEVRDHHARVLPGQHLKHRVEDPAILNGCGYILNTQISKYILYQQ